jgi:hypothetical protein
LKRQELKGFHHTSGDLQMILKFITKNGTKVHGPPYTKKEEADFYGRNANGHSSSSRNMRGYVMKRRALLLQDES